MSQQRTVFARPRVEVSPVHLLDERTQMNKMFASTAVCSRCFRCQAWSSLSQFQNVFTFKEHVLSSSLFLKTNHMKQKLVKYYTQIMIFLGL